MNTRIENPKAFTAVCALTAAIFCGSASAEDVAAKSTEESAGLEKEDAALVASEFEVAFHSKYLNYGFLDYNDPILVPRAALTFADWVSVGADFVTYLPTWQVMEFHPKVSVGHTFSSEDYEWLPTSVEFLISYIYEYIPDRNFYIEGRDTQFWNVEIGLPDLWLEPWLWFERDTMRDSGTYVNLELGHTFALIDGDGDDEDPVLSLRPSVAQGFGNALRVRGYALQHGVCDEEGESIPLDHAGLMDSIIKLALDWKICDHLTLGGHILYSDFLFDRKIREAARDYEYYGNYNLSGNFVVGLTLTANF